MNGVFHQAFHFDITVLDITSDVARQNIASGSAKCYRSETVSLVDALTLRGSRDLIYVCDRFTHLVTTRLQFS